MTELDQARQATIDKCNALLGSHWAAARAAMGAAQSPGPWPGIALASEATLADLADPAGLPRAVRDALAGMHRETANAHALGFTAQSELLALKRASASLLYGGLDTLCRSGMFEAAVDAFDSLLEAGEAFDDPHAPLALLVRHACGQPEFSPSPAPFPDAATPQARLARLAASPWWGAEFHDVLFGKYPAPIWAGAWAAAGRAASSKPALGPGVGLCMARWAERRWGEIYFPEHFGRDLGKALSRMKIAGGALDELFWAALPTEAKIGLSLSMSFESKMGAWTSARLMAEALDRPGAEGGAALRAAVAASFWSSLEPGRVNLVEASLGPRASQAVADGIRAWAGSDDAPFRAEWAQDALAHPKRQWARKALGKAWSPAWHAEALAGTVPAHSWCEGWVQAVATMMAGREAKALEALAPAKAAVARSARPRI